MITDTQIRIKVAELMGAKFLSCFTPNYPESLDACKEFEATLNEEQCMEYDNALMTSVVRPWKEGPPNQNWIWSATPRQRCIAFLTINGVEIE